MYSLAVSLVRDRVTRRPSVTLRTPYGHGREPYGGEPPGRRLRPCHSAAGPGQCRGGARM